MTDSMLAETWHWPVLCRPSISDRGMGRFKISTLEKYAASVLPFVRYANNTHVALNQEMLAYLAKCFAVGFPNQDVGCFHAEYEVLFGFADWSRITCEREGVEKMSPHVPTTPSTLSLAIASEMFAA